MRGQFNNDVFGFPFMEKGILSVGDCVLDVLCPPLPFLPEGDSQLRIDRPVMAPGGNSLNFALACSMVHKNVSFMGAVGGDEAGRILRDIVSKYPLKADLIANERSGTAMTIAIPDKMGRRRLLSYSGANHSFIIDTEDISMDEITHLHRGGYWFTESMMGDRDRRLLSAAMEAGVETSLDPATDPLGFSDERLGKLIDILEYLDIIFLNEAELLHITGEEHAGSGIEELLQSGVGTVFLHRGEKGASWKGRMGSGSMPASKVVEPKNPTGCGDVFNGVLVGLLHSGYDIQSAVSGAQKASAIHLASSIISYPSLEDICDLERLMVDIP